MYSSANFCHHIPLDFCPLRNWRPTVIYTYFLMMMVYQITTYGMNILFFCNI